MSDLSANGGNGQRPELQGPSFAINAQYIKDLSFENPNIIRIMSQQGNNPEISLNLGVQANGVGPESFEVVLTVRAEA
jgi:preprotein translocase subunit SecB